MPGADYRASRKLEEFFRAAKNGKLATVRSLLITAAVDPNARNFSGSTALHYAVIYKRDDVLTELLKRGASVAVTDGSGSTPLSLSALGGAEREKASLDLLQRLHGNSVNIQINGETLLHIAVNNGLKKFTVALLDKGADPNAHDTYGQTPLHWAAWQGDGELVGTLLKRRGVCINDAGLRGTTALHAACAGGHLSVVELLVNHRASLGYDDVNAHADFLVAHYRADVGLASDDGYSPVMIACRNGHAKVVRFLVRKAGAEVNRRSVEGYGSIHIAVSRGHTAVLRELLCVPTLNVNQTEESSGGRRWTALHMAVKAGSVAMTEALLSHRDIEVFTRASDGSTALHFASGEGMSRLASLLLAAGACVNAVDDRGDTPLSLALSLSLGRTGRESCLSALESSGALTGAGLTGVSRSPTSLGPPEGFTDDDEEETSSGQHKFNFEGEQNVILNDDGGVLDDVLRGLNVGVEPQKLNTIEGDIESNASWASRDGTMMTTTSDTETDGRGSEESSRIASTSASASSRDSMQGPTQQQQRQRKISVSRATMSSDNIIDSSVVINKIDDVKVALSRRKVKVTSFVSSAAAIGETSSASSSGVGDLFSVQPIGRGASHVAMGEITHDEEGLKTERKVGREDEGYYTDRRRVSF